METQSLHSQIKRRKRQKGVTVVEYALMLALVAIGRSCYAEYRVGRDQRV